MSVYIISDGRMRVKIGWAVDPRKRLLTLQSGNADALIIIRLIDGGVETESWMHREFREWHIRYEWFTFCDQMLSVEPPKEHVKETRPQPPHRPEALGEYIRNADRLGLLTKESKASFAPFFSEATL